MPKAMSEEEIRAEEDLLDEEPVIEFLDAIDATEYSIGYSIEDNEMRVQFHNEFGVLSSFVTDAPGAYELAQRILKAYDKLEGL